MPKNTPQYQPNSTAKDLSPKPIEGGKLISSQDRFLPSETKSELFQYGNNKTDTSIGEVISVERINKMEIDDILQNYMKLVNDNIQKMEERLTTDRRETEQRTTDLYKDIRTELRENNKKSSRVLYWVIGICVATFIGLGTMVLTSYSSIVNLIAK